MSTLAVGTIQSITSAPPTVRNTSGTEIGAFCRAWVNFNGTGTVAIRAAFNVSSVTDNGVGSYTVNFTAALPDTNYVGVAWNRANENHNSLTNIWATSAGVDGTKTTTAFQLAIRYYAGTIDSSEVNAAFFR